MIRRMETCDLAAVVELWRAWLEEDPIPGRSPGDLLLEHQTLARRIVARTQPGVALYSSEGAVLLWAGQARDLHGFGVYVTPKMRGTGLGTRMLEEGCKQAQLQGFDRVLVSPYTRKPGTQIWLGKAGFTPVQLVMERKL